jgi:hypothetical protein
MSHNKSVKSLYSWKPLGARPVGWPKTRWEDDVKADIMKMKVPNWKTIVQNWTKLYVSFSVKKEEECSLLFLGISPGSLLWFLWVFFDHSGLWNEWHPRLLEL